VGTGVGFNNLGVGRGRRIEENDAPHLKASYRNSASVMEQTVAFLGAREGNSDSVHSTSFLSSTACQTLSWDLGIQV
jgi:hypothetical protein